MEARLRREIVVAVGAAVVLAAGWAMFHLSYDIWGALVIVPLLSAVGVFAIRRTFRGDQRELAPIALIGLVAKLGAAMVRYWVAFDAYGGSSDSQAYHAAGSVLARRVRDGEAPLWSLVPKSIGTSFIEHVTGILYTFLGSGRLAGFMMFAFLSFWGLVLFVKAAIIGIPGLARRRYAVFCFLTPTVLFWPSSIGKEAWLCLCLGLGSWGGSMLVVGRWRFSALTAAVLGLLGAGFARPHVALLWTAGLVAGLFAGLVTGRSGSGGRQRTASAVLLVVAVGGFALIGTVSARYLNPDPTDGESVSNQVSAIFNETTKRSSEGGSAIQPAPIDSPIQWPYAIERTLLRPAPWEIDSVATALPGLESFALLVLLAIGWRRVRGLPKTLARSPYLVATLVTVAGFGIAFSTLANLGLLVRQRSLIFPLMLVLWCLPPADQRRSKRPAAIPIREREQVRPAQSLLGS